MRRLASLIAAGRALAAAPGATHVPSSMPLLGALLDTRRESSSHASCSAPPASYALAARACSTLPSSGWRGDGLAQQLERARGGLSESRRRAAQETWEVIEFLPSGAYKAIAVTPSSAGLDPRDFSLFAERRGFSNQRATLSPRAGEILFRTEVARAIIRPDRALVFASRREKDTMRLVQACHAGIACAEAGTPFELSMLEALLAETARQFERHYKRLQLLSDSVEREVAVVLKTSSGDLTRMLPIQKRLTEMRQDVLETRAAIKEVLNSDRLLAGVCLSGAAAEGGGGGAPPRSLEQAALLLEGYERQISTVESALKEKQDYLEVVREVWAMQLDSTRNRIIRINLILSIASFALLIPTVPAAFFGMNLTSGLEEARGIFWPVVSCSLFAASFAFLSVYTYWKHFPNARARRRIGDVRALHDLLSHHIDDLEDVMAALRETYGPEAAAGGADGERGIGRKHFTGVVRRTIRGRSVSDQEVDLLYRTFDANRDGFLSLAEVAWNETKVRSREPEAPDGQ